jgi:phosphoribosylformylglycinamidine synthase
MVANVSPTILNNGVLYDLTEIEPDYIKEYSSKACENKMDVKEAIQKLCADPNFASKNWIYAQYDHTVGARTSLAPGKSGAAGIWLYEEGGVLGLTIDSCPRAVFLNPYEGSRQSVWEAYRNLVSSGFKPLGITDCLNYGNPERDEVAYQFVKSIDGISKACTELEIPVVSGNVSFYNECEDVRVYPTPTIGMAGYAKTPDNLLRAEFQSGESIFLIGKEITDNSP